ncbi:hypothetical protein L207DRAFT_584233 [Hyaloscypha variabilis F]|uniref:Uncharacterized protein n=1 Tax=Hyaloscypha variabilis (strain UAMH 11265 / GT02V1 / F) TaxID=1149755 RepID=A0A2J6RJX9_HYAVF|nr:hypothetical protein L207DRAFT_584233 [Hyaloscypha variabilis F]
MAPSNDKLNKAIGTRNCCVVGLCVAWFTGFAAIGGGFYCIYLDNAEIGLKSHFIIPHAAKEMIPLGMNILVTFLNESMGYIHSTTLRWSLQFDNRLTFNSNLRLLSSSARFKSNKWYANVGFLFSIILSYATTSLIFLGWNPALSETFDSEAHSIPVDQIRVSGIALIFFGIGLLGQAGLATWALNTTQVPTWSSNPLDTVLACTDETNPNQLMRRTDRCMKSVHQIKEDSHPCKPKARQGPACTAHPEVKWVLTLLWLLVPLGGIWGGAIYTMILRGNPHGVLGNSWSFVPTFTGTPLLDCNGAARCTDGTSVLNVGWTAKNGVIANIGSIFLIAFFQAVVTLALHCAELLVNLSRDEGIFRMTITPEGTNPRYNSIIAAFSSWQTITLFVSKAAVHWLFGLSINNDFILGVNMYPPQIIYFTAFALMVAIFSTYVSLRRPVGPLPATFGHLQTMADLIDDWEDRMFWGHKQDGYGGLPSYAGTSARRLQMPRMDEFYGGAKNSRMSVSGSFVSGMSEEHLAASYDMQYHGGMFNSYSYGY